MCMRGRERGAVKTGGTANKKWCSVPVPSSPLSTCCANYLFPHLRLLCVMPSFIDQACSALLYSFIFAVSLPFGNDYLCRECSIWIEPGATHTRLADKNNNHLVSVEW